MLEQLIAAWHRLKALVLRRRLERDLDEEVAFHLSMREADYAAAGAAPADARDAARRRFGNPTYLKEQMRETWTFPSFESIRQDVRYALRTLWRSPGFSLVAILALAIGIGGNTAIFSLMDAMRARALPYRDADRLVELWGNVQRAKVERRGTSYPDFQDWRAQVEKFRRYRGIRFPEADVRRRRRPRAHPHGVRVGVVLLAARRLRPLAGACFNRTKISSRGRRWSSS